MKIGNNKNIFLDLSKGFTLVETFVAITILMLVALGPMSILATTLRNFNYIKNEIIATYLAQEGVEILIDSRNQSGFTDFNTKVSANTGQVCFESDSLNMNYGYYVNSTCPSGKSTVFSRLVTAEEAKLATPSGPSDQYLINSAVSIVGRANPIIARSRIFAW